MQPQGQLLAIVSPCHGHLRLSVCRCDAPAYNRECNVPSWVYPSRSADRAPHGHRSLAKPFPSVNQLTFGNLTYRDIPEHQFTVPAAPGDDPLWP